MQEKYQALVEERCAAYKWDVSDHVKEVMKSMLMGRDKLWMCGSFSQAVLDNNLGAAVRQADDEMVNHLKQMVIARDNFFLNDIFM